MAIYERLLAKSEGLQQRWDPLSAEKEIDRLHKVPGTRRKKAPLPCRSKIPMKMQDYIREVVESSGSIMTTTRMIALLKNKFPNEESYPKKFAIMYFFRRALNLTYKKVSNVTP